MQNIYELLREVLIKCVGEVRSPSLTTSFTMSMLDGFISPCTIARQVIAPPEQVFVDMRFDKLREGYENRVDVYQLANVILFMLGIKPINATDLSYIEVSRRLKDVEISELSSLLRDVFITLPMAETRR